MAHKSVPRCIVIAGPNGAGKTTFAKTFLPVDTQVVNFLNADLIAAGLSPLKPERASRAAGRILLGELERLTSTGESFALESTLSGQAYREYFRRCRKLGYRIDLIFLKTGDPSLNVSRVAARVKQGGHHVPTPDVLRRHARGWANFAKHYKSLADECWVFEMSGSKASFVEHISVEDSLGRKTLTTDLILKGFDRAAKEARRMAKMHGTTVWVMIDGKVVGLKP